MATANTKTSGKARIQFPEPHTRGIDPPLTGTDSQRAGELDPGGSGLPCKARYLDRRKGSVQVVLCRPFRYYTGELN